MGDRSCFRCGLRILTRALSRALLEPSFETSFAKSSILAGNYRPLTDFCTRVLGVWISDHLARIVKRRQSPAYQFIEAKRFRASNFDSAIDGRSDSDTAHSTCYIIGGHRLEK